MTPSELTANASTMVQELRDKIGDTLVLAEFTDDELLEAITNNNDRDVLAIAIQLIAAECVLDDAKHDWILSNIKALVGQL